MPELTRSRVKRDNHGPETWQIYYGGVTVGTISERSGNPLGTDPWTWSCGFYPGGRPGEDRHGTAATFAEARAAFEAAWRDYLPKHTEADFRRWRHHTAWTVEKYARWERGERTPPPWPMPGFTEDD